MRRFTEKGEHLHVFDKPNRTSFKAHIRNVASTTGFYRLPSLPELTDVDPNIVEGVLAEYESRFADTLRRLLHTVEECSMIDPQLKLDMALFMAFQYLRTAQSRTQQIEMGEAAMQRVLDLHIAHQHPELSDRGLKVMLDRDTAPLYHAQFMLDPHLLTAVVSALDKHIWVVGLNNTSNALYTSDSPVVLQPHKGNGCFPHTGLASEGIEIAFPLTPKHVLLLYERTFFHHWASRDCQSIRLDAEDVSYFSALQVFQSYRQVYSSEGNFALAKEVCDAKPEVCDPERPNLEPDGMTP